MQERLFKAHRLVYQSTLGLRVIQKKTNNIFSRARIRSGKAGMQPSWKWTRYGSCGSTSLSSSAVILFHLSI